LLPGLVTLGSDLHVHVVDLAVDLDVCVVEREEGQRAQSVEEVLHAHLRVGVEFAEALEVLDRVVLAGALVLWCRLDLAGLDSDSGGELRLVEVPYPRSVTVVLLESTPLEQSLRSIVLIVNLCLQWRSLFESVTQPVKCGGCDATPVSRKVTEIDAHLVVCVETDDTNSPVFVVNDKVVAAGRP
jgi:hypothetical protein